MYEFESKFKFFWWVAKKKAFESVIFATGLAGSGDFFRREKRSKQRVGLDQSRRRCMTFS